LRIAANEKYTLLTSIKVRVDEAIRDIDKFTQATRTTKEEMSAFGSAVSTAAGMLMRDLVQSFTRGFQEAVQFGAQVETLRNSFNAMIADVGATNVSMESLRKATRGTVADIDLLKAANTALSMHLPIDQLNDLYESAMIVGNAMGISTTQAVDDLTLAIGRQSPLILDNLGITVRIAEAQNEYAARLGKTSAQLTEQEKKTAFMTMAIEALNERADVLRGTTGQNQIAQEQWAAAMKNATTAAGEMLAPLGMLGPTMAGLMPIIATVATTYVSQLGLITAATNIWAAVTSTAASLVTTAFYGIPIIGWIALAIAALMALKAAWESNFMGIQEVVQNVIGVVMDRLNAVMQAIEWASKGIQAALGIVSFAFTLVSGTAQAALDEQLNAVEESYAAQAQAIVQRTQEMLDTANEKYAAMVAAAQDSYMKLTDETVKHWLDQLNIQATGWDKVVQEYQKHFDQILKDTLSTYSTLTRETEQTYRTLETETQRSYDDQISATRQFYSDMLGEARAFLDGIRNSRTEDLENLELNYLLRKNALEAAISDESITQEQFDEEMKNLEAQYRDDRTQIGEDYRIQEIQATKQFREDQARIEAEQAEAMKQLEQEKADAITQVNTDLQAELTRIEQEKAAAIQSVNEQKNAKMAEIEAQRQAQSKAHADELSRIEQTKQVELAGISAQGEVELMQATRRFNADTEAAFKTTRATVTSNWSGMWDGIRSTARGIASSIGGTISSLLSRLSGARASAADVELGPEREYAQAGFTGLVTRPTAFNVGEGGQPEWVEVTPIGGTRGRGVGGGTQVVFRGPIIQIMGSADEATAQRAGEMVLRKIRMMVA